MLGITTLLQAAREKWHDRRSLPADQRDLPSFGDRRVVRASPDLDSATNGSDTAAAGSTGPERRLDRMMQLFHIERRELQQDYPGVLRDAEVACLHCKSKRRCFRELEAGTAAAKLEHFCPNADLFLIFADNPQANPQ